MSSATVFPAHSQTFNHVSIVMEISKRHSLDVTADRCTYVPVLGCLTTIPRMLISSIIGCATCPCATFKPNTKWTYISNRAHMECCRGLWESIPFGICCMNNQVEEYNRLGINSKFDRGQYIYRDPKTNNVFYSSVENLNVYGWAHKKIDCDDDVNECACCEYFCPSTYPIIRPLQVEDRDELKKTHNIFPDKENPPAESTINQLSDTPIISEMKKQQIKSALRPTPPSIETMSLQKTEE